MFPDMFLFLAILVSFGEGCARTSDSGTAMTTGATSATTTVAVTTTAEPAAASQCTCNYPLQQADTTFEGTTNGVLEFSYSTDANGCTVPSIVCRADGQRAVEIVPSGDVGSTIGGGCGTATAQADAVVCKSNKWTYVTLARGVISDPTIECFYISGGELCQ